MRGFGQVEARAQARAHGQLPVREQAEGQERVEPEAAFAALHS